MPTPTIKSKLVEGKLLTAKQQIRLLEAVLEILVERWSRYPRPPHSSSTLTAVFEAADIELPDPDDQVATLVSTGLAQTIEVAATMRGIPVTQVPSFLALDLYGKLRVIDVIEQAILNLTDGDVA